MAFKSINNFYLAEAGTTVTHFVQKYEKLDGTPKYGIQKRDNLSEIYAGLDPRFSQTIAIMVRIGMWIFQY